MEVDHLSIEELPNEVLIKVFNHCSPKLLKISALVCRRWNNIIGQASELMKNFTLNLVPASTSKVNEAIRTNRRFKSLKTNKISPSITGFMERMNLRSLELTELVMDKNTFAQIFAHVENLEKLVIDKVRLAESDIEPRKCRLNRLMFLSMTQVQGDVFSFIETRSLKTYKERIHDSTPLPPIVEFLLRQPLLEVLELSGGHVDSCYDPDRFINAPFQLKHLSIIGGDLNRNSEHMKRFLSTQTSLKELRLECKIHGSLLTFVLQNMRGLESLQIPTNFQDFHQLIAEVKPLTSIRRLRIVTALTTRKIAKSYFKLFPELKSIDLQSIPRSVPGAQPGTIFIQLHDSLPAIEELHLAEVYFPTKGYWKFSKLREFHVEHISHVLPQVDEMYNEFLENHSETLEKISIGLIHNASFAKGTTIESIKTCKKLKEIRIGSESPMATRMLKKLSLDDPWQLITDFRKTIGADEIIEVKFNFPDDEALWRDKCQVWDDELVRELSTVENYGLNSFVNMYK